MTPKPVEIRGKRTDITVDDNDQPTPAATPSSAKKPLFIALIVVGALIVLSLLLFVGQKQFAGKAISFAEPTYYQGGVFVKSGTEDVGNSFTIPIRANIKTDKSVALSFKLSYDSTKLTADCTHIFDIMDSKFIFSDNSCLNKKCELYLLRDSACGNGLITFSYGGLCKDASCSNAFTGDNIIANIKFTASEKDNFNLDFSEFNIINIENSIDLIPDGTDAVVKVVDGTTCIPACLIGQSCVSGKCVAPSEVCPTGKTCCVGIAETDLQTDNNNCGSCSNVCVAGESCTAGKCVSSSDVVDIPDAALKAEIITALGSKNEAPLDQITVEEANLLTNLNAPTDYVNYIINLKGLEKFINLNTLNLYGNHIVDVSPLNGLINLKTLGVGGNKVVNINTLNGLINLESLSLNNNQIVDINALTSLTKLTYLQLQYNQIVEISSLSGLTNLQSIFLENNKIVNLGSLKDLTNLNNLAVFNNPSLTGNCASTTYITPHDTINLFLNKCLELCTPSCTGKVCGTDGCGGSCGVCQSGEGCNAAGQCEMIPSSCTTTADCLVGSSKGCSNGKCVDLPPETNCADGIDNDNDGKIDCLDPNNCLGGAECAQLCNPADWTADEWNTCTLTSGQCGSGTQSRSVTKTNILCNGVNGKPADTQPCVVGCAAGESCSATGDCVKGVSATETVCEDKLDNDNDQKIDCQDSDCKDDKSCLKKAVNIKLMKGNLVVADAEKLVINSDYSVSVTITSEKALPDDHLVVVILSYGDKQEYYNAGKRPGVDAGGSEVITFNYKTPKVSKGKMDIKVLVWNGWLSISESWMEYITPTGVSYEVQ